MFTEFQYCSVKLGSGRVVKAGMETWVDVRSGDSGVEEVMDSRATLGRGRIAEMKAPAMTGLVNDCLDVGTILAAFEYRCCPFLVLCVPEKWVRVHLFTENCNRSPEGKYIVSFEHRYKIHW